MSETPSPCVYTSMLFIIVAIIAFRNNYNIYGLLWIQLCITSILYHGKIYTKSNKEFITYYDRLSAYLVVLYGGYLLFDKIYDHKFEWNLQTQIITAIIIISFLLTIILYHYGFQTSSYCFDDNKNIANIYHIIMHLLSIIGHILIILL